MKIFVQSSVFLPTPAPGAGAVEYIVSKLAQGLAARGHDVTLFALEGSDVPGVDTVTVEPQGSPAAREAGLVQAMVERAVTHGWPDVLFDHSLTQLAQRVMTVAAVTMSHGMAPIAPWAHNPTFTSRHHARLHGLPDAQVLYNGIDVDAIPEGLPVGDRQQRLVWAGRILPYKRPHVALDWAWEARRPLVLAGPIGDARYFQEEVEPRVRRASAPAAQSTVEYVGELDHDALLALFRDSAALLFTSDGTEPFGIVMLEAMASGCPVLAYDAGANREIVANHETGRLVPDDDEAIQSLRDHSEFRLSDLNGLADSDQVLVLQVDGFWTNINSAGCRRIVADLFGIARMIESAEQLLTRAAAEVPA